MGFAVLVQVAVWLLVTVLAAAFGQVAAWSAFAAGAIAVVPNAVLALYVRASATTEVYRFFVGEAIKILVALAMAVYFWRQYGVHVQPVVFWVAFVVVLKAYSFALLRVVNH